MRGCPAAVADDPRTASLAVLPLPSGNAYFASHYFLACLIAAAMSFEAVWPPRWGRSRLGASGITWRWPPTIRGR